MLNRPDGVLAILIGVSRSGKSVYLKSLIERVGRIVAFDPKGEYVRELGFKACHTQAQLISALASSKGDAKIAFVAIEKNDFQFFCQVAKQWNRQKMAVIVCEELANVTNSGKASGKWGVLVSQGLAEGPIIVGTVQRGQEVDKSILSNATYVHIAKHTTQKDRKYIGEMLDIDTENIPSEPLKFLQWTSDKGVVTRGSVDFMKSRTRKSWPRGGPRFRDLTGKELVPSGIGMFENVVYR
ncbi:Uncharacterised protein [Zhongshania aliphaticivorans]|uniref:Uncharacterized protein n=1 Tax=Zhongshania aliphaticivorans TaxID=1470434 RepID=A0A5S9N7N6_9GAMM|nr:hypothetical protein [Zhongshania aliphaticivorans]CAA0081281.1 Uncharacterised protein [Zhongshania aliphaticivorans]CAA0085145.1 Uncharacterised protein [Zhongshania aliphaticivorans]